MKLKSEDVTFSSASIVDEAGRVFFYGGRVFRAIYTDETASFYKQVLNAPWVKDAFDAGLVLTWIPEDISLEGAKLILEHQLIPFAVHPAECTSNMHWLAAKAMIRVNKVLSRHGLILKDAHPWNLMFYKGYPVFVDFGSVIKAECLYKAWLEEFRRYYAAPIWLSLHWKKDLAHEYRRQHLTGFGLRIFDSIFLQKTVFRSLNKLQKYFGNPLLFFQKIDEWLDKHPSPIVLQETWASYQQSGDGNDPLKPTTPKHQFIYEILTAARPKKVLDCASNKGFYSALAAKLGASVIAFDYEEYCVDKCYNLAKMQQLDITPVLMDFTHPTPASGLGLLIEGSYQRMKSDIVLALGLSHHICITQGIPVKVFCEICMNYAERGIVFEYVDPMDKHVSAWGKSVPFEYSLEGFSKYFSQKFKKCRFGETLTVNGIYRTMVYFYD